MPGERTRADTETGRPPVGRRVLAGLLGGGAGLLDGLIRALIAARSTLLYLKLRHADFRPRPDDIFIATYPRSGTTWMQMILYQMTTRGEMDFQHISEVCPWFERNIVAGRDLEALPSPRVFKTHLRHYLLPKRPCRHIYVARNGKDVAVSLFHFYRSHFGFGGEFADFFEMFMAGRVEGGSWFDHVKGWRSHQDDPQVLFLYYSDLKSDLEGSIRQIAAFCDLTIPQEQMPRILERCSFDFMKRHEAQFDHTNEILWESQVQESTFLRRGQSGEGVKRLTAQENDRFDRELQRKLGTFGEVGSMKSPPRAAAE